MLPKGWVCGEPRNQAEPITEMAYSTNNDAKKMKCGWYRLIINLLTSLSKFMHVHTLLLICEGQRTGVGSLLPPYGFWGSTSNSQTRQEAPLPAEPPHCPRTTLITSAEVRRLAGCGQHPFGIQDSTNGGRHWRAASIQHSLLPDNDAVRLEASSSCSSASQPHGLCPESARVGYFSLTLPWTEHLLN